MRIIIHALIAVPRHLSSSTYSNEKANSSNAMRSVQSPGQTPKRTHGPKSTRK
jgi:hypothetical protein